MQRDPLPPPWLVHACADLYRACVEAPGAPDKVIARAFREDRRLVDELRGFVADTVQGMLRARGFLETAMRHVGGARDHHAALVFLKARRGIPAGTRDAALGRAIEAAERETGRVDGFFPAWLREALPGGVEGLRALTAEPPVTLRANALRLTREDLAEWLWDEGIESRPTEHSPWGLTLDRRANIFRTDAFREGAFEMQDEASQLVALLCAPRRGDIIVDSCAGAGGKTLALSAMTEDTGTLVAFDTASFRLEALRERAARAGIRSLQIAPLDAAGEARRLRLTGGADIVLVDAPCSGTGVLRRNPDIAWKLREDDLPRLVAEQEQLLRTYAPLVKPGGRLVYAVCSLLAPEGTGQIARFLRDHPEFRRVDAGGVLKTCGVRPGTLVTRGDFAVDPLRHGLDGFYAAVLERGKQAGGSAVRE